MEPYKRYVAAMDAGNSEDAYVAAKAAWQQAENTLADHKTTGDLAINFAILYPPFLSSKDHKTHLRAYARAIELAPLHEEGAAMIEVERHMQRLVGSLRLIPMGSRKYLYKLENEY